MKTKEEVMTMLENIKPNTCMLVNARLVEDANKIQLEFAEVIQRADQPISLIGALNTTDPRFNSKPRARRAWASFQREEAKKAFGIDFATLDYVDEAGVKRCYIGKTGLTFSGRPVHLQINETINPSPWQADNLEKAAKSNGSGTFYLKDGNPIFSNVTVVAGKPSHVVIQHDEASTEIPTYFDVVDDTADVEVEETNEAIV